MELSKTQTISMIVLMTPLDLKKKREDLGFSQDQLSKQLKVARNTVSRWELGNSKIPEFLELALEALEKRLESRGWAEVGANGEKLFCFYSWDEKQKSNVLNKFTLEEITNFLNDPNSPRSEQEADFLAIKK